MDGSRNVTAIFTEFSIPIVKTLDAQFALRYDKYSDFGNTVNPKVAIRWQPAKSFLTRASYNTGFHAPTLPDLLTQNFRGNTADAFNDPVRCPGGNPIGGFVNSSLECDAQFNNQTGGNKNLTPEKSKQWTLGIVADPSDYASVSVDYWSIYIQNQITTLGDTTIFGDFKKYEANGTIVRFARLANGTCANDVAGVPTPANIPCAIDFVNQTTQNLGDVRTSGFDVNLTLRAPASDAGRIKLVLDGTYTVKYDYQKEKNGAVFHNAGNFTSDNRSIPRWRHYLTLSWDRGPWSASVSESFVLGYLDDPSGGDRRVASWDTYDVQGSWTGLKNLQFVLGIKNLFDRNPPVSVQGQTFQVGYDPYQANPLGRVYYGKINYAFK